MNMNEKSLPPSTYRTISVIGGTSFFLGMGIAFFAGIAWAVPTEYRLNIPHIPLALGGLVLVFVGLWVGRVAHAHREEGNGE